MSQTALGQAAGMTLRLIRRVELGSATVSAGDLFAIATILSVPMQSFFDPEPGRDDEPTDLP